jgi:subtilisin family serine protease
MGRALILSIVALLLLGVLPAGAAAGPSPRVPDVGPAPQHQEDVSGTAFVAPMARAVKHPTLDSRLVGIGKQAQNVGQSAALDAAREAGVPVKDDRVRVEIRTAGANTGGAEAAVTQAGGTVEHSVSGLVQALVPPSELERVATASGVQYVQPVRRLFPTAVAGEEVHASGADGWHTSGAAGSGVKIAVLDGDFQGYTDRQASGDLPTNLTTRDFCLADGGLTNGHDGGHGTAVAEIVYEMAPGAQLYLVCATTLSDMVDAVQYMTTQGIQIVNHSRGIFNTSRADGAYKATDSPALPESLITTAAANNILWVNSSGNSATSHWSGAWADTDNDGVLNFAGTDEGNNVVIGAGGSVTISLKWDDWTATPRDYDLYLSRISDGQVVAFSARDQGSPNSALPTEEITYTNQGASNVEYFLSIVRYNAASPAPRFDLFVEGFAGAFQYNNPDGSLTDFAVSPRAEVVGAACWSAPTTIESYSSRGPTIDGRIKPDITGHDSESSATYGAASTCGGASGFAGTSAASPEVAAAAALLRDTNPSLTTPAALMDALKTKVTDAGAAGADSTFGSGVLTLGSLGTPAATCTTSPNANHVVVSTSVVAGALKTTVTATGTNNALRSLVFANGARLPTNAVLALADGRTGLVGSSASGPISYIPPYGSTTTSFSTTRQGAGQAVTVPFVVTDRCGTWSTFVGGGTSAGF